MTDKEKGKKEEPGKVSRREFLKDAGLIVGGASIGSMARIMPARPRGIRSEWIGASDSRKCDCTAPPR